MDLKSRLFRAGHAYDEIRRILARVEPKGLCLDLPAGKGVNYRGIVDAGFDPVEADLFPDSAGPPDARRVKLDFNAPLPFRDRTFAAVLCSEGIEHPPAQGQLVAEFHRILAPGGSLLITTPNVLSFRARLSTLLNGHYSPRFGPISEATQFWRAPSGTGSFVGHAHMIDYFEMRFILRQHGFELRAVSTAKYSHSSVVLAPLLWLPVRLSTARLLGRELRAHPEIRRELLRHSMSRSMLLGKKLILLAERTDCIPTARPVASRRNRSSRAV